MTTKPKATKFRVRRSGAPREDEPRQPQADDGVKPEDILETETEDGFGDEPFPTAAGGVSAADHRQAAKEISDIKNEGLSSRQLRMARRVAQKYGLAPSSDYDAVRLLRQKGLDPFQRANMLELVAAKANPEDAGTTDRRIDASQLPSTQVRAEEAHIHEVRRIQRDIARRRRLKLALLTARLTFFVFLPTFLAGYYYYNIATPMYATNSEFVIQQADAAPSGGGGLGGLLSGTGLATSQDSITVQGYLQSREAMLRLNGDVGFKQHFSDTEIDPIQRLALDATNEDAYKLYKKHVKIGYDPSEGVIKMEVIAANPETSVEYSRMLIDYAEEQVDNLTQRLREDQMKGARDSFDEAEIKMNDAQRRVLSLQEQLGVLDPASESSALMSQISTFETQLQEKRLGLQQLLSNEQPNQARVSGLRGDVQRLEDLVANLRSQLTESGGDTNSLARISGELRMAEVDLETRQMMMQQSLQQMETSRIEANRQVRYLSLGVSPIAPDEPTYPKAFENTLVAFLIFGGIYMLASLTAAILREQVSA